jgi:hypothetical protein
MKYHTENQCCVKLEGLLIVLRDMRMSSLDNVAVVHKADNAIQLINELLGELKTKE